MPSSDSGAVFKLLSLFLGLVVVIMGSFGLWLALSAQHASDDAHRAAEKAATVPAASQSMPGMSMPVAAGRATPSFANAAPANADALAMQHAAFPAELPPAPAGAIANVNIGISHDTLSIAPGIKYDAWTFNGSVPGPVVHVREGQTVHVTLHNTSPMPHSVDFHAARIAPNLAFSDILPGQTKTFSFRASDPGVYMVHCGTAPAFVHIANGMYFAIIVEPANMPPADVNYVLVASEFYLNKPGLNAPASLDLTKAQNMTPDWVTWNGYAGQYKTHPLTAQPGQTVRFWVVDAGPSLNTEFHVVGTVLDRAWLNADLIDAPQHGIQTAVVPAGGGGVFDVKIDKPGIYPFVSHSFASVALGEVGLLKVGNVAGTMNH
ncbi:MAG TPA: multicopper oxidase domain-containing protein [Gaiellaceae bacterium]